MRGEKTNVKKNEIKRASDKNEGFRVSGCGDTGGRWRRWYWVKEEGYWDERGIILCAFERGVSGERL